MACRLNVNMAYTIQMKVCLLYYCDLQTNEQRPIKTNPATCMADKGDNLRFIQFIENAFIYTHTWSLQVKLLW